MTKDNLKKGNELNKSLNTLNSLRHVVSFPFPEMFKSRYRRTGFVYDDEVISFARLDEQTRNELIKAIYQVIDKRQKEINDELKEL